jgi:hypothetical protein
MLVYYFTDIDLPFGVVEERLLQRFSLLDGLAEGAYREGEARRARIDAGDLPVAASVRLEVGQPVPAPGRLSIPLSWTAEGASALFPRMDGDLILSTLGPDACQLSLHGSYRPPLGAIGRALDRMLMHRVAESSVKGFVDRIARSLEGAVTPGG